MTRYSLFVLKVSLNTNKTNTNIHYCFVSGQSNMYIDIRPIRMSFSIMHSSV